MHTNALVLVTFAHTYKAITNFTLAFRSQVPYIQEICVAPYFESILRTGPARKNVIILEDLL